MATYDARAALPNDRAGPWGEPVKITYDQRDVLLYATGIGTRDLRFVYERHPEFSVFPTFAIRWGGAGAPIDRELIPNSPGPLNIDAERYLEVFRPLPLAGDVSVRSRLIGAHPRGRGNGFVECESEVRDAEDNLHLRMVNGSFRRGVETLGDIEPFEGAGRTFSERVTPPEREPDVVREAHIADNQAHIYRLSGDYNPLHIDPEAARFGGFNKPILHGLCTFGHCAHLLLDALCEGDAERFRKIKVRFSAPVFLDDTLQVRAWDVDNGRALFEARVGETTVVSNAYFEWG